MVTLIFMSFARAGVTIAKESATTPRGIHADARFVRLHARNAGTVQPACPHTARSCCDPHGLWLPRRATLPRRASMRKMQRVIAGLLRSNAQLSTSTLRLPELRL